MSYVFTERPQDSELWFEAFDAKYRSKRSKTRLSCEDWESVLGDCDAVSDLPCAAFSEELIEACPEAKVIFNRQKQLRSVVPERDEYCLIRPFHVTFCFGQIPRPSLPIPKLFRMGKRMFGDVFDSSFPDNGIHVHRSHSEIIKRLVDGDRLLVLNVKEGWALLYSSLGLEIAKDAGPFPRVVEDKAVVDRVLVK
ncbi:hypothetical protein D0868_03028 [Hortaea werneckii]|uniref:Uncharacterized protein n=1 Tax=Hortaea werneckii TaxID=91943 RepID=A0A3M6Z8I7_HORWE|nr:hypothetical protein D0868_03028 [Hortaea werneckii]